MSRRPSSATDGLRRVGGGQAVNGSKMLKEIREQPEVLERVLNEGWGEVHEAAGELRSRGFRCVMLAARGTSGNAALYAKYLFEVILGVPTALASPSTFTLYESKDVLETVRRSGELGAGTLSVTNDEGSALAAASEFHFFLRAGREESVAATKTY